MKNLLMFILFISIPVFGCDSDKDGSADNLAEITTQLAKLKTYQLAINLNEPKQDAIKRLRFGDFRLLWLPTNPVYPSSEKNLPLITEEITCILGERRIEGVGNPIESEEQAILSDQFFGYAIKYNDTILENWKNFIPNKDNNDE